MTIDCDFDNLDDANKKSRIQSAKEATSAGDFQRARRIYESILEENVRSEEAWLGLAGILTEIEDKRLCYENVLKINSNNQLARVQLQKLAIEPLRELVEGQDTVFIDEAENTGVR